MALKDLLTAFRSRQFATASVPTPPAGSNALYPKSDDKWYTKNSAGTETLVGPGTSSSNPDRRWDSTVTYATGDVVGYAGGIYRAIATPTVGLPPALNTALWEVVRPPTYDDWNQNDPYFESTDYATAWEAFWTTGTINSKGLTTTAGEFESGKRAFKVDMAASSSQRLYSKRSENLIKGGEIVQVQVRAKMLSGTAGQATVLANLHHNDETGLPEPLATGAGTVGSAEGTQALTTSWATYTFTMTAPLAKPRAIVSIVLNSGSAAAVVVVDWCKVSRTSQLLDPPGVVKEYAGFTAPPGYLMCDGTAYNRTTYANLFASVCVPWTGNNTSGTTTVTMADTSKAAIGMIVDGPGCGVGNKITAITANTSITLTTATTAGSTGGTYRLMPFGNGDGSTTFNVPNRKGVTGVGVDGGAEFTFLGDTYGEKTHLLLSSESGLVAHTHTTDVHTHNGNLRYTQNTTTGGTGTRVTDIMNVLGQTNTTVGWTIAAGGGGSTSQAGPSNGGSGLNVIQPSIAMNYIIKT